MIEVAVAGYPVAALPQLRCHWLCRRRTADAVAAAAVAFDSIVI